MRKNLFIKKVTALSLCAALLLSAGAAAEEGTSGGTGTEAVTENPSAEDGASAGTGTEAVTGDPSAEEGASAGTETEAVTGDPSAEEGASAGTETEAVTGDPAAEDGTSAGTETEAVTGDPAAEDGSAGETESAKNTSTGYVLKHFTLYDGGEMVLDMENLTAELDFAAVDGISGVRLLISSEDMEAGYIAASYIDDSVLLVLHGGLSGQTVKYKIAAEKLTTVLDSDDFNLFLRGTADGMVSGEQEAGEAALEDEGADGTVSGAEEADGTVSEDQKTEKDLTEEEIPEAETQGVSETEAAQESETQDVSEAEETAPGEETQEESGAEEAASEAETQDVSGAEETASEAETQEESGAEETALEAETQEESGTEETTSEIGTEEQTSPGGFMINGLSLTNFAKLLNEAYILLDESVVKNETVEVGQGTLHRSGIVLDREHMNRLLEICAELGIDRGVKAELEAQNIHPEGGALLWGSDDADYKAAAGSFGVTIGDGAPVWNTFGVDMVDTELTFYNYRMPEQQAGIESGVEVVFNRVDSGDDMSWVPVDDADAIDVSDLEPAEVIEKVSKDVQMVLYDMMGGVLSAVLEEIPEEMLNDILGIDVEEEAMSEAESGTGQEEAMSEAESGTGQEEAMSEAESGANQEEAMSEAESGANQEEAVSES